MPPLHRLAELQAAGIPVEFASIQGGEPPVDGLNVGDAINARYWGDAAFCDAMRHARRLGDVDASRYAGIFFCRRPWRDVGLSLCHGPAALVDITLSSGAHLITGKNVSAFTDSEERAVQLGKVVPFLLASTLEQCGALHHAASDWAAKVVVDGRLIAGQTPQSASGVDAAIRDAY